MHDSVLTMERDQIIMSFSMPPSLDDIEVMAKAALGTLPEEFGEHIENLAVRVEDFPDEAILQEMDLEDPYELLALYRSGSQIAPGVTKKSANDDDVIIIFRRPLLDAWCEICDDLTALIRQVMIEELGQNFDFTDEEIEEMAARHYQGML
jgi:predicted Zn-dependent protease with MMP-like domain